LKYKSISAGNLFSIGNEMSETVYAVSGKVYRYEVYYPGSGKTYYVRKLSKANTKVGKDQGFSNKVSAIQDADRRARSEGLV
jgi:hypothetical protein